MLFNFELKTLIGAGAKTQLVVCCLECTQLWVQSPIAQKKMVHDGTLIRLQHSGSTGKTRSSRVIFDTQRSKPARAIGDPVLIN